MKAKITIKNIYAYLQGTFRYKLYYSSFFKFLIRTHILEQIDSRILSMDRECFSAGQCKLCGCNTTALQMANKTCDGNCYPEMLSKKDWHSMKAGSVLYELTTKTAWLFDKKSTKFKKIN